MDRRKSKTLYGQMYPSLAKWLNTCLVCGTEGYTPELPERLGATEAAENLRKMWSELAVNEYGVCEQCAPHS